MIKKKLLCLVLSLAFVVMSSQAQAQPGGSSTQVQAKTDSTVSRVWNWRHWRFQHPKAIFSKPSYDKYSKWFNDGISSLKLTFLSIEKWKPYGGLGIIEHVKKIIEGKDSLATNLFGSLRQIAIATDGKYRRGVPQILEQLTSDKCDCGKVGEGFGYIIKGLGSIFYRPWICAWQYGVTVSTLVKDVFLSPTDTHYTYKKAYNDFKEIFKTIGATIDVSPIGLAGGALYYKIKGCLMVCEADLCDLLNLECNDQNENNIYSNDPVPQLRKLRYVSLVAAPILSTILWVNAPQLAVGNLIPKIISGALGGIITYCLGPTLGQLFESQQAQQLILQPYEIFAGV
jgi:hypothetical protein